MLAFENFVSFGEKNPGCHEKKKGLVGLELNLIFENRYSQHESFRVTTNSNTHSLCKF